MRFRKGSSGRIAKVMIRRRDHDVWLKQDVDIYREQGARMY